jgi:predicted dehydrogenase
LDRRLRVGVVGTSFFADAVHLPSLRSHPRAEVTALCSRDRAHAQEVADRHGGPVVFTDDAELMASGLVDAVVLVTPDDLHHDMTVRALESGLHVLCEKPLARTASAAREMLEAAESAGRVHMTMFSWRWLGVSLHARRLIADGYLGRCHHADFSLQAGYGDSLFHGWRFNPHRGSGILGDLGSHMIDLARCFVGEIARVSGRLFTVPDPGRDGAAASLLNHSAMVLVEFVNGAQGTIRVSGARVVPAWPNLEVRLYGDQGTLRLDTDVATSRLMGCRATDESWTELPVPADLGAALPNPSILDLPSFAPFTNLPVADRLFVDAALGTRPAESTFADGWRAQQVVDAVIASDQANCWITLPEPDVS